MKLTLGGSAIFSMMAPGPRASTAGAMAGSTGAFASAAAALKDAALGMSSLCEPTQHKHKAIVSTIACSMRGSNYSLTLTPLYS